MGSNKPLYKPKYWETVKKLDQNGNTDDPGYNCMPAGVPRGLSALQPRLFNCRSSW